MDAPKDIDRYESEKERVEVYELVFKVNTRNSGI